SPGPMLRAYATRASIASMSRKSSDSASAIGSFCHVRPASAVRTMVPFVPLAQTTRSFTALMPRKRMSGATVQRVMVTLGDMAIAADTHTSAARKASRTSVAAAGAFELVLFIGEQDVEAGERAVAAGDVGLQLHLGVLGQVRRVDLLFERAQAVSQHHDLVEEGFDRPGLFLQVRLAGTQDELA